MQNFTVVTFKMGAVSPEIVKIGNFWYKFAKKWYTPSAIFINLVWGRESQARTLTQNFTVITFKMGAVSSQNRRNW